jgi:hypothetical protein
MPEFFPILDNFLSQSAKVAQDSDIAAKQTLL